MKCLWRAPVGFVRSASRSLRSTARREQGAENAEASSFRGAGFAREPGIACVPLWSQLSLMEECRGRVERALASSVTIASLALDWAFSPAGDASIGVALTIEPGGDLGYSEHGATSRRQLDCQRDAVEPPADRGCSSRNAPVWREMRIRRPGPCDKQPNRAVPKQFIHLVGTVDRYGE